MADTGAAEPYIIPLPVLGLNTVDLIPNLDPNYALEAENYFSDGQTVYRELGYTLFASSIGVNTMTDIFSFCTNAGTEKLCAIGADSKVYDITAGGSSPVDLSAAGTKLVPPYANSCTFMGRLFVKSSVGSTNVWFWDGATGSITDTAFLAAGAADSILKNPQPYKGRLYFCADDASFYYGGLEQIQGVAPGAPPGGDDLIRYNLASIFSDGGKLWFVGGVNRTGQIDQEYFVAISSRGEVLVYKGEWPGDTATPWGLIGHYRMPRPIGDRSFFYWAGDLCIITIQGVVSLSQVMQSEKRVTFMSDKITPQFGPNINLSTGYKARGIYVPNRNRLIVNIPTSSTAVLQYQMSTITGGWWKRTGLNAWDWAVYNGEPYFVGNYTGKAWKALNGYFDESAASPGTALTRTGKLRCAPNRLAKPGQIKQVTMIHAVFSQENGPSVCIGADADYSNTVQTTPITDTATVAYTDYSRITDAFSAVGDAISVRVDATNNNGRFELSELKAFSIPGGVFPIIK